MTLKTLKDIDKLEILIIGIFIGFFYAVAWDILWDIII